MKRRTIKKVIEKSIEGVLLLCSSITSIAILLIIVFLFREGFHLFGSSPVEEETVLIVNKNNPVDRLSAVEIKNIFDQHITNWKDVAGKNDSIILFRIDNITDYFSETQLGDSLQYVPACITKLVDSIPAIIASVPIKYVDKELKGKIVTIDKITAADFFGGTEWLPTATPSAVFGTLPIIMGTLWVSLFAIIFSLPLGLAAAIYMAEIADNRVRNILKPLIELLAGIPSVVFGFFGLIVLVPLIQNTFNLAVGETALAGSIILGIMALPTIITVSEDAIRTTPRSMKEASLALGATKWQTILKVTIPYSISGITAGVILGIGRAIGETMAVLMVTGNAAIMPTSLLEPIRTIPATIAAELGEASQGGLHYQSLFMLGCILFGITLIINLTVEYLSSKRKLG